jgi:alpha/beta superfamily hydrolase
MIVINSTIKLPSSGRELILSYRISSPDAATSVTKLCLISHPLARLGGSKEDHVVRSLTEALVEQSYLVVTYDSRSAGGSSGSCSFT